MNKTREEQLVNNILSRIGEQSVTGRSRRLPAWATAALFGAGLSLSACQPPAQEPCDGNCNNQNNLNNYNNINNNHPLYGINNINNNNNQNNMNNMNNMNNLLYGVPDDGGVDLDTDCPQCEYMAPMYGAPEDAGTDVVILYGMK